MAVPASLSKWAHPPRSNAPCSSSSGPPGPCITPSTETCVVVVSFMIGVPFLAEFVVVRFHRTAAPISSVPAESLRANYSAPCPNVGDVVILNEHREHRPALFRLTASNTDRTTTILLG